MPGLYAMIFLLKNKNKMNILLCCNENYAIPLTVCMTSILENNRSTSINFYVFYSSLQEEQKNKVSDLVKKYGQNIDLIQIDNHYFSKAPTMRWSKETYYRLLMCDILPPNTDRLLYLDCDTIVNASILDFYNTDLKDKYMCALKEEINQGFRAKLNLDPKGDYYQGGIILFDFKKTKEILSYKKSLEILSNIGDRLIAVDQDITNILFDGKILAIDKKFNNSEITSFQGLNIPDKDRIIRKTCIFHYATGKPWNNLYSGACEDIWYKYLLLSPYKEIYYAKFNKLKYWILRTKLVKRLFYKYIKITPHINNMTKKIFPASLYISLKETYRKYIK